MNSHFITELAEHIKSHYNLQKEELTVVFPNKRAAFYLRSRFKEIYTEDIWLPQMLSIQEAVTQWSGIRLVDNVEMLFELISIDSERSGQESNISVFGNMAAQMANDFDEIDQYQVDASHLFSYIAEEKRLGLWTLDGDISPREQQYLRFFESLKQYYDGLRQRLEQQGKGYYGMITRFLAGLDDEELLRRTGNKRVVFAGFNALTPTEQKIIDRLYRNGRAEVIWDFDRYYVEDPQNEAGWFARKYIAKDLPWKPTSFSDHLLHNPIEIHLVGVNGNTIQSKALQCLLQVEVEENPAVILADEKLLIPVLNAIPDDPRYSSLMVSMGYPLRQTSLSRLVANFFTLRCKGRKVKGGEWYLWPILRLLDLEIIKVVFTPEEVVEMEQYKASIVDRSIYIFRKSDFEGYCKSDDTRQFMTLLLGSDDPESREPLAILEALRALLAFLANKLQSDAGRSDKLFLLNQVSEVGKTVNRLKEILERYPRYISGPDDIEVLYRLVADNTSIKLNSSSTTGLQLMGLLEARNLDFDTFYMVGVNEGVLPAEKSYNSFIPFHIRKEVHLPDYQEKQAVYAYHFYRQLQNSKRVYFLYNQTGDKTGGEPSRFLLQLKYELAVRNPHITLKEEAFASLAEKPAAPETLSASKTDEVMRRLMKKVSTNDIRHALAPTSLAAFVQCPLRFYLKHLMKIEDNSAEEETQSNVIGTIVHNSLERLYRPLLNTAIDKQVFSLSVKPALKKAFQDVIRQDFVQGLPDVGYNYLNNLTIDKLFENYLKFEEKAVERKELVVLAVEDTLSSQINVGGVDCTLAGKADRIDSYDGLIRIVDYKTGSIKENEVKVPKNIESVRDIPEKAMQLLIYKYLYLKSHPALKPDQVTAVLFGLKNQRVVFPLSIEYEALKNDFMATMESLLEKILGDMMDRSLAFSQPSDTKIKPCHFCDFKTICLNTVTGARLVSDH